MKRSVKTIRRLFRIGKEKVEVEKTKMQAKTKKTTKENAEKEEINQTCRDKMFLEQCRTHRPSELL